MLISDDLKYIVLAAKNDFEFLRDKNVFITGGTGFFGIWLLSAIEWANRSLDLNLRLTVLSRDPQKFRAKAPHFFAQSWLKWHAGDVRDFKFPTEKFDIVIHAATDASAQLNEENPLLMLDTIIAGTRNVLDFVCACGAKTMLFTSSGAVYGRQPPELEYLTEEYSGAPNCMDVKNSYHEGKRLAELMCATYAGRFGIDIKIARCFAFVGPYLPLDVHFAIGNFIRNGLERKTIEVNGDGSPFRSYLYSADLVVWLLGVLVRGQNCRPYNVGSQEPVSIASLAKLVAQQFGYPIDVSIKGILTEGKPPERYVPSTARATNELRLHQSVNLISAIRNTISWHGGQLSSPHFRGCD